jgi:hypothetical protein
VSFLRHQQRSQHADFITNFEDSFGKQVLVQLNLFGDLGGGKQKDPAFGQTKHQDRASDIRYDFHFLRGAVYGLLQFTLQPGYAIPGAAAHHQIECTNRTETYRQLFAKCHYEFRSVVRGGRYTPPYTRDRMRCAMV